MTNIETDTTDYGMTLTFGTFWSVLSDVIVFALFYF